LLFGPTSSTGEVWSLREKMRPWRLKTGFTSLATNWVLLPEFMKDTCLLIVAQLELVMINVPSASKLAPSMTFERLICHQDVAFVICVTPQDVTPILLLAGYHLHSWPDSVLNAGFPNKNATINPVIRSGPVSTPCRFFRVIIACNMLCLSV